MRISRRCGYSAATRPRLSHMPRTIASTRSAESSGIAARRFRRARLETPRRGPIQRATAPPNPEAASSGNAPMAAKNRRAPQASIRYDQGVGDLSESASIGAGVASVTARQAIEEEALDGIRIVPADLDLEHVDAVAQRRGKPDPILCRGDKPSALALRNIAQPGYFALGERVMIGKRLLRCERHAEHSQRPEELLGPTDTGERNDGLPGETLAIHRPQLCLQHRTWRYAQITGSRVGPDQ